MADKFLNETGIATIRDWANGKFAKDADLQALDARVDEIVEEGGEPNVIETVKVNGTALVPDAQKAVDITVPIETSDLSNDGDGTSPFATQSYVQQTINGIPSFGRDTTTEESGIRNADDTSHIYFKEIQGGASISVLIDDSDEVAVELASKRYVENAVTEQIGKVYKPKGSVTFANLPALSAAELGNVYNVTDAFVTTADFKEGAGTSVPAGSNVGIINDGTDQDPVYKYDLFSGIVDLSDYWTSTAGQSNSLEAMTVAEINAILEPATP